MDDFGYHYSSRISRFHHSYSSFEYYSPVFTESYWYNYEPYTWGLTIYSGGGFANRYGHSWSYPAYYSTGWSAPGYYNSYYWGYDPFDYDWYTPVVINVRIRNYNPNYRTKYITRYDYGYNSIRVIGNHNNSYYGNDASRFKYASSPYPSTNIVNHSRRISSTTVSNSRVLPSRRASAGSSSIGSTVNTGSVSASGSNQAAKANTTSDNRRVIAPPVTTTRRTNAATSSVRTAISDKTDTKSDERRKAATVRKADTITTISSSTGRRVKK
jgi:hypothetical protein